MIVSEVAHARRRLVELDRFRQVSSAPCSSPYAIGQSGVAGDEDDRQVRRRGLGARPLDHLETAEAGHLRSESRGGSSRARRFQAHSAIRKRQRVSIGALQDSRRGRVAASSSTTSARGRTSPKGTSGRSSVRIASPKPCHPGSVPDTGISPTRCSGRIFFRPTERRSRT